MNFVKKLLIYFLLLTLFSTVYAQEKQENKAKNPHVKTWHVSDRFGKADSIPVDTAFINYHNTSAIDRYSISNSYNANLGSPIQSKIFFDRLSNPDFIFATPYTPYLLNISNATFYNTKKPFSILEYKTGGTRFRDEDRIRFLFTGNANKRANFGTSLDYIHAGGEYGNQSMKRFDGSVFGSYSGKHYSANGLLATNNLSNFENGGITDLTYITNPISGFKTKDIPTNTNGMSNLKETQFFFNHQYTIGFERPFKVNKDSVRMDYVPVTRFTHTLKLDEVRKRFYERATDTLFYQNTYRPHTLTNDTASLQTMTNTLAVSMAEEFNKWMKFGLTAFVENDVQRYGYEQDTILHNAIKTSTRVGGILSKEQGDRFKYNILGELDFLGYKAGNFRLEGNMGGFFKLWNDSISLIANGFIRSDKPSFFMENYESNHFIWKNNNFNSTYRTNVGGTFSIPTRAFSLNVSVENITNFLYFNNDAMPTQHHGNIQVIAANLKQDFHFGSFTLENNVVYQLSSQPQVLPLPDLTLYHNLYVSTKWFNALDLQLGADVRYHTLYYAPAYMPATGQFHTQSDVKIGNYPVVNLYLNFHLKRTRFYIEYYHINQLFMKGLYLSMPNYPINPALLKAGLLWNFYD